LGSAVRIPLKRTTLRDGFARDVVCYEWQLLQFFEVQEAHPLEDEVTVPSAAVLLKLKADMRFLVFFDPHEGQIITSA